MRKIKIVETELEDRPVKFGKDTVIMKIPKFGAPPLLFRADTREQSEIKAQGFQAVNPYSLKDAKTDVKDIFTGGNIMTLWVQNGPSSVGNKWISTADERECMGFTSGRNVYVIKIDNLQEVNIDETVLCLDSNQHIDVSNQHLPRLYLNANNLDDATIIGVRPYPKSREIVFFTPIPPSAVIGIVDKDEKTYTLFD